jgi:hypothetical protein
MHSSSVHPSILCWAAGGLELGLLVARVPNQGTVPAGHLFPHGTVQLQRASERGRPASLVGDARVCHAAQIVRHTAGKVSAVVSCFRRRFVRVLMDALSFCLLQEARHNLTFICSRACCCCGRFIRNARSGLGWSLVVSGLGARRGRLYFVDPAVYSF